MSNPNPTQLLLDVLDDMAFLAAEHKGYKAMRNVATARREVVRSLKQLLVKLEIGEQMPVVARSEFWAEGVPPVVSYELNPSPGEHRE